MLPDSRMLLTLWLSVNHLTVCEARSDLKLGRARLMHCSSRQAALCFISKSVQILWNIGDSSKAMYAAQPVLLASEYTNREGLGRSAEIKRKCNLLTSFRQKSSSC